MSRYPTFTFYISIMSKWLAKHISTKVSFKITIRKRHVYIDIRWSWIWNQCLFLGIWNDDRTKMIVLPSFPLATRWNSQNTNEINFINEIWHINCLLILIFPIGIIEVSTSRKCCFWFYFSSLHDYWHPSTWNSLVHTSWGEKKRCEKRAFHHFKMRKKKISWNIKTKCVTDFFWQLGLEYEGLYLTLGGEPIKDKRLH
jgi:hypothetical protein